MKYREITKLIEQDGWYLVHQVGSHQQYKHPTKGGRVTIAGKPGKDVPEATRRVF
jgi:predicted RNA binding protein YcfA (HicA-like mRNA interferase family)